MWIFWVTPLIAAGVSFFLGSFILSKNPSNPVNRLFFLINLGGAWWAFTDFGLWRATTFETASAWLKFSAIWPFIVACLFHFSLVFTEQGAWSENKFKYTLIYFPAGILWILGMTTDQVLGVPVRGAWGWIYEMPNTLILYVGGTWALGLVSAAIYVTWQYHEKLTDKMKQQQTKYVMIGLSTPVIAGFLTTGLVSALDLPIPELTAQASALGAIIIGYAIITKRLFELTPALAAETILATMSDFLFLHDFEGIIQQVNQTVLNELGYEKSDLIGHPLTNIIFKPNVKDSFGYSSYHNQIPRNPIRDTEMRIRKKDGVIIPISVSTSIIRDDLGNPKGIVCLARNIAVRKKAEEARLDLEERRSDFISMTSHELRTPLTSIRGYSEILEKRWEETPPDIRIKCFNAISRNIRRLERLIAGVSSLGQLERGEFLLNNQEMDFCMFLTEALQPYQLLLENQLEVRNCSREEFAIINGDADRLHQVFDKLIENAIKHSDPQTRKIVIIPEILSTQIRVQVLDNGAGIAPENLERIFDQFISIPTSYSAGGTGIGLFIARLLVNAHNGTLTAQSEGKNKGATFILTLPRYKAD